MSKLTWRVENLEARGKISNAVIVVNEKRGETVAEAEERYYREHPEHRGGDIMYVRLVDPRRPR